MEKSRIFTSFKEKSNENIIQSSFLFYGRFNLSNQQLEELTSPILSKDEIQAAIIHDISSFLFLILESESVSEEDKKKFSKHELEKLYEEGTRIVHYCTWARLKSTGRALWIQMDIKLMLCADTKELLAFCFLYEKTKDVIIQGMRSAFMKTAYERGAAIIVKDNVLIPIFEVTASYSPYWDGRSYDEGWEECCKNEIPVLDQTGFLDKLKLKTVIHELQQASSYELSYDILSSSGKLFRKQTSFTYMDQNKQVILVTRSDIEQATHMQCIPQYDLLTGVFNRNQVFKKIRILLDSYPDIPFVFYHIDIDRFNLYNTAFGEEEGNKLLCFMAKLLEQMALQYPICAYGRLGSDQFCLCVPYDEELERKGINFSNKQIKNYRSDYSLKLTYGAYRILDSKMSVEDIRSRANLASRQCKEDFNCKIRYFDEQSEEFLQLNSIIASEMKTALEQKQFTIYLQPKFSLLRGCFYGSEALVRWIHPTRGIISPGVFIPVFEKNGFIAEVDYYVWEQVCILLHEWINAGITPNPISVNISRVSLYNPKLKSILKDLVTKYEIPTRLLELEITESVYMTNPSLMKQTILGLHEAGFTILMDDFGSGYSSLNTLKEFPIDVLKIDMKFLPQKKDIQKAEIIIASVIKMAKWLGLEVIMEGVETKEQKAFLIGMGCDYIQGYYYARPMPIQEYEDNYLRNLNKESISTSEEVLKKPFEKTIVVIEDDEMTQEIIRLTLEKDYYLKQFKSAEEALEYLQESSSQVHLIMTDNILPGMQGIDFLEYCRWDTRLSFIPKIFFTADDDSESQILSIQHGADDFILKPFYPELLIAHVKKWINMGAQYSLNAIQIAMNHFNGATAVLKYYGNKSYLEYANQEFFHMFGVNLKSMIHVDFNELNMKHIYIGDLELAGEMMYKLKETGIGQAYYRIYHNEKKEYLWIYVTGKVIEGLNQTMVYYTFSDVTKVHIGYENLKNQIFIKNVLQSRENLETKIHNLMITLLDYYAGSSITEGLYQEEDHSFIQNKTITIGRNEVYETCTHEKIVMEEETLNLLASQKLVVSKEGGTLDFLLPILIGQQLVGYIKLENARSNKEDISLAEQIIYMMRQSLIRE